MKTKTEGRAVDRSITKPVITTYINHSRPLILDEIHVIFYQVGEESEARPILIC